MREASSLVLAARLQGEGATCVAYDPVAERPAARAAAERRARATRPPEALDGADAAVLVTEWPEFAELDWEELAGRMANPLIVDGRNFLDPERAARRRASPTRASGARAAMQAARCRRWSWSGARAPACGR